VIKIKMSALAVLAGLLGVAGCGNNVAPTIARTTAATTHSEATTTPAKSNKRGIAYDLASPADLAALAPGVSWWYNWSPAPNTGVPTDYVTRYSMDFYPMLWNGNFDTVSIESFLRANQQVHYLLVLNEPNVGVKRT